MQNLQRVNLLLERRQREALERLAHKKGHSISELVRMYITRGLDEENSVHTERLQAIENARALKERILQRRGGRPITDSVEIINRIRDERSDELLGH